MEQDTISATDVIVIGAGAAGLMCAATLGKRGRRVRLLDHSSRIAEKIRISGGGRCNFTNIHTRPECFLSENPHFCRSALGRYTPHDFIGLVERHGISFHEKKLGQLFCDGASQQIIDMLLSECRAADAGPEMETKVLSVRHDGKMFTVSTPKEKITAASVVIATGGLSIPKIGATPFGYTIARQFGINVVDTRAALVPLTFDNALLAFCRELTGLSVEAEVSAGQASFPEGLLFTHRGLSGPSILQISSYWKEGDGIRIDLMPGKDASAYFLERKRTRPKQETANALADLLPRRLAQGICDAADCNMRLADCPDKKLHALGAAVNAWAVKPSGNEGYRTAEVTLGGVDTSELSAKTMESRKQPGLFFIGEVVDVTGHLGGFNFQWAWSSGFAAAQHA